MVGGLQKVDKGIKVYTDSKKTKEKTEYKDKFPKDSKNLEEVKDKYGVVVWCKFTDCRNNKEIKDLQRTSGKLLKNMTYKPLSEEEATWTGICTRDEIGITYNEIITSTKSKFKVPSCFVAATNKTGHIDFTRFLQSDGSPIGGNIDSQHPSDAGFGGLDPNNIYG